MFQEDEDTRSMATLPTPTDTPFRTPRSSRSKRSLRRQHSSPAPSSSPPFSPEGDSFAIDDRDELCGHMHDEHISILDPRRFTPTLHASLVSEILSLRRDLESKTKTIDNLEASLDASRVENVHLGEELASSTKEHRSLKRQMSMLEGGTMSAIDELAKERDEAMQALGDVRKRLEQSQEKVRKGDENQERTEMLWERDRETWDNERRQLERKAHVVEGRLKAVLEEVAAAQRNHSHNGLDSETESPRDSSYRDSDTTSMRSKSIKLRHQSTASTSTHDSDTPNYRFSVSSAINASLNTKLSGLSLAEELALDEEDEEDGEDEDNRSESVYSDGNESPDALPEERRFSRRTSARSSVDKARKILGLDSSDNDTTVDTMTVVGSRSNSPDIPTQVMPAVEMKEALVEAKVDYADIGIQYSPPPSPKVEVQDTHISAGEGNIEQTGVGHEHGANQGRKRSSPDHGRTVGSVHGQFIPRISTGMVSASCQTLEQQPLSPPYTPRSPAEITLLKRAVLNENLEISSVSISTQTEEPKEEKKVQLKTLPPPIPVIAIHPPQSAPSSPRDSVVLPPQTKNASCQASVAPLIEVRSISMQTEEIRIDQRPVKLPPNLLPSALQSEPFPTLSETLGRKSTKRGRMPPAAARRKLRSPPPVEPPASFSSHDRGDNLDAYPGNNDNGPLSANSNSNIRRPFRTSSLFAGFDAGAEEDDILAEDAELSEEDIFSRPMRSYTLEKGRLIDKFSNHTLDESPMSDAEDNEGSMDYERPDLNKEDSFPPYAEDEPESEELGPLRTVSRTGKFSAGNPLNVRKAAMISSGSSPSIGSSNGSTVKPPFPVPTRHSSRNIPLSSSDGARSPTSQNLSSYGTFRRRESNRSHARKPSLRKVQSAAAIPRVSRLERQNTYSPPPLSASAIPDSPLIPPLPDNDITSPRDFRFRGHRPAPSTNTSWTGNESSTGSTQQTGVVDAIAQTMVGEWMWKYVRRRKSFGVPDSQPISWDAGKGTEEISANITGNGVRHKRWVWLAPYERAVMWSGKQPISGSALMGKSGRKLAIQSVLDVKDDTPLPKGSGSLGGFNRSILILTPQRALKFTAPNGERHYLWLTALSFLSHSRMNMADLPLLPPVPPPAQETTTKPTAALRRHPIRDSIRVAKDKAWRTTGTHRNGGNSSPSYPPINEMEMDEAFSDAAEPPTVPRFSAHSRKRSNTAPRAPPGTFRSLSSNSAIPMPSSFSFTTAASSDVAYPPSVGGYSGLRSGRSSISQRPSEASGPSSVTGNYFDAIGTVRMEAFIDKYRRPDLQQTTLPRTRQSYRTRQGRKKDMSYWGAGSDAYSRPSEDSSIRTEDPFRGF
ncbi:MAG: hypothetical protein M1834_007308 [Cirrosporium novae-zelandiae]|nr:MAG: hypothetical protein M1834_007308 [Cirrosporium novae-zelandiae]